MATRQVQELFRELVRQRQMGVNEFIFHSFTMQRRRIICGSQYSFSIQDADRIRAAHWPRIHQSGNDALISRPIAFIEFEQTDYSHASEQPLVSVMPSLIATPEWVRIEIIPARDAPVGRCRRSSQQPQA